MGVNCYRVVDVRELPGDKVEVETYSLGPLNTNVGDLLEMVAPQIQRATETVGDLSGGHSVRYRIPTEERAAALALLESHLDPVVTAIDTGCDVSVCLDFYRHPADGERDDEWVYTALGDLVHDAKYRPQRRESRAAVSECHRRLVSYIESHPVLCQLTGVAAMPGSRVGSPSRLLSLAAKEVSDALGVPIVELQRTTTAEPQKNLPNGADRDANQRDTMSASIVSDPGLILVVDDFMAHGSTVREASRALRKAGAQRTASVTLAKDRTGTRRFRFE